MTMLLSIALALIGQPPEMEEIKVTHGRDMAGLRNYETVIRGTCDGQPASATITLVDLRTLTGVDLRTVDLRRRGRVVLRTGRLSREMPSTFLNGSLVTNGIHWTGLACDGRRLQLNGLAVRTDAQGEIVMDAQEVTWDLRTGDLTMSALRTLSPAETRSELSPN